MLRVTLTLKSKNVKTGPIPVSTTSPETCPDACPLRGNGCYAETGPIAIVWRKVADGTLGGNWRAFCKAIAALPLGQLWRHNQAGDLPGRGNKIDSPKLWALVAANRGKRGFTYTHKPMDTVENRHAVEYANAHGFTINLSANNLAHADSLTDLGIAPVVTVLPSAVRGNVRLATPAGRRVVVCPATYRDDVTCASCQLCWRARCDHRLSRAWQCAHQGKRRCLSLKGQSPNDYRNANCGLQGGDARA